MTNAKPFLKWAGGKRQLIKDLIKRLPKQVLETKIIDNYIEPFIGGGSFFFYLKSNFLIRDSYISDINKDLVLSYRTIRDYPEKLIFVLKELQTSYLNLEDPEREVFYYKTRKAFNQSINYELNDIPTDMSIKRTSQVIFLNKTCFNGLYRQNRKGEFNVPFGRYKKPLICDESNLHEVNRALQNVTIEHGDFELSRRYATNGSLIYLDPPYRPIKKTSNFTSYTKEGFTDFDQERLAEYYTQLSEKKCNLILSNSDPQNHNESDNFFVKLYKQFYISKVEAKRSINANASGRGSLSELMITSYELK